MISFSKTPQKTVDSKPAPAPKAPPPPPPAPKVTAPKAPAPQSSPAKSSFDSGASKPQSWQQFSGGGSSPKPSSTASAQQHRGTAPASFRVGFGGQLVAGGEGALRTSTQPRTGVRSSSLLTEGIGDGSANCLERAYAAAGPNDSVTLLRDRRDSTGHAVVERADGTVFDPSTARSFATMEAYLAQNANYELRPEPQARRIPRSTLENVFSNPPNSPARQQAIEAAGLSGIAEVSVADPPTPEEALAQIQELLKDGLFNDVSHDDMMAIENILRSLPPDQINGVVAGLSDAEIAKWVEDLNDPGIAGMGPWVGLNDTERASLFDLLANNLDPSQAGRYFTALDRPEQMVEFGEAYLDQGDVHERLGFLVSIGNTTFPDGERSASASVIATGLDSLISDPGRLAIAVRGLSSQNLQDALLVESGLWFNDSINTPFSLGQYQFDNMGRLERLTDALATTEDYVARAKVFDGLGDIVRTVVRGDKPVLFPDEVANQMTGMMTDMISNDLPSIVRELSGSAGIDPLGASFVTYAKEQLRQGGGSLGELAGQMRALDLNDPNNNYGNAFLSGYFAGAVLKAADTLTPEELLGPDYAAMMGVVDLILAFRADPVTGIVAEAAISEAERASIEAAMRNGGAAVREALLQALGVEISPDNDNGTPVGAFEQGLLAVYGSELYGGE